MLAALIDLAGSGSGKARSGVFQAARAGIMNDKICSHFMELPKEIWRNNEAL